MFGLLLENRDCAANMGHVACVQYSHWLGMKQQLGTVWLQKSAGHTPIPKPHPLSKFRVIQQPGIGWTEECPGSAPFPRPLPYARTPVKVPLDPTGAVYNAPHPPRRLSGSVILYQGPRASALAGIRCRGWSCRSPSHPALLGM